MSSGLNVTSEKNIYNRGYNQNDIFPDRDLIDRLLRKRDQWIEARLSCLPPGISVLDVGCGCGGTSIGLAEKGFRVTGVDISDERISTAKRKSKERNLEIRFLVGDIENMAFTEESYQLITCSAVLHHLPMVDQDIQNFKRLLKKDGAILITEPGLLNPFAFIRRRFFPTSVHTPGERPFIPARLRRIFQTNYREVECEYFYILSLSALIMGKVFGAPLGKFLLRWLEPIDSILTKIPLIREFSWIINVHARK